MDGRPTPLLRTEGVQWIPAAGEVFIWIIGSRRIIMDRQLFSMNIHFRNSLYFILISLLFVSCFHHETSVIDFEELFSLVQDNPDSALFRLNGIDESTLTTEMERSDYSLLHAIALHRCYIDVQQDSSLVMAAQFFDREGPDLKRMLANYYLGIIQSNGGNHNAAIVHYDRAEVLATRLKYYLYLGHINIAKGRIYTECYNEGEALRCDVLGLNAYQEAGDSLQIKRARAMLAYDYNNLHRFEEARSICEEIINKEKYDTLLLQQIWPLYASLGMEIPELGPTHTVKSYETAIRQYGASLSESDVVHFADALYRIGKKKDSYYIASLLPPNSPYSAQLQYQIARQEKQTEKALHSIETLMSKQDSLLRGAIEQSVVVAQRDYHKYEEQVAGLERDKQRNEKNLLIVVIAFLGIIAFIIIVSLYLYFSRRADRNKQLIIKLTEDSSQMLKALSAQEEELATVRKQYVSVFKKQFQKVAKLTEVYRLTSGSRSHREDVYKAVAEIAVHISDDQRTFKELERKVDHSLNGAMKKYRLSFPNEKEAEYHFVCYLMAGFPASTIALLTGETESNVYSKKSRILSSLRLGSNSFKDDLILAIE